MVPVVKSQPPNAGDLRDTSSIPGLGRSPGEGQGKLLQYSCLENRVDRGDWPAMVCRVTKSQIWLKQLCARMHARTHTHTHTHNDQNSISSREVIWWSHLEYRNHSICFEWMPPLSLRLLPLPSASLMLNSLLVTDTLGISTTLEYPVLLPYFTHTFVLYYFRFTSLASDNTNTLHHLYFLGSFMSTSEFGSLPQSFFAKHQANGFCQRKP